MRMTGIGSLGFSAEIVRRVMNGEGISRTAPMQVAPGSTGTDVVRVVATAPQRSGGITQLPVQPGYGGDVVSLPATPAQRAGTQQAPAVLKPGVNASPGGQSPASSYYGAGDEFYSAPDAESAAAAAAAAPKAPGGILPLSLLAWALFS